MESVPYFLLPFLAVPLRAQLLEPPNHWGRLLSLASFKEFLLALLA
jgi:hypothetical protein